MELLLEKDGANNINDQDEHGQTALHHACANHFVEIARLLVDHGANVNAKDEDGTVPLLMCNPRHPRVLCQLRMLLERGADVNARDPNGYTLLILASMINLLEMATLVIEFGADVNAVANNGRTPLSVACRSGYLEFARLLLDNGANAKVVRKKYPRLAKILLK